MGKIVNGAIIDRVGGRVMLLTGLWGAVLFSGGFALVGWQAANAVARGDAASPLYAAADTETADTTEQEGSATLLALLITLWSVVRYCQSMAWGSIMKILPRWIGEHAYGRVLGLFNLTYGLGDAAVRLMLGLLILAPGMQWWDVWMVACGMAVLFGMPTVWWVKATPRLIGEPEPGTARRLAAAARSTPSSAKTIDSTMAGTMMSAAPTTTSIATLFTRMRPILASARFWTVLFYYVGLTFVRETFLSWTAQFLSERMQLTDSASGIWSLVVPLFAAVSAMLGGYLIDRVPAREKELVSIGFLALNVVALVGLSALLASGQDTPAACLALLSLEAFGMEAPYTFIDGIYAIQIGGKESAAMTVGVIQAAGNVGGIAAGYAVGVVTHRYGWGTAFAGMAGIVGVVLLVQVLDFSKKRRNAVRGAGASAL